MIILHDMVAVKNTLTLIYGTTIWEIF